MKISEMREEVGRSVPDRLQETLLRSVFVAYSSAEQDIAGIFDAPERRTLAGYAQRAKLETQFRAVPRGRKNAKAELVSGRRAWTHTRLTLGRVVLTASKVPSPSALPPKAQFRRRYAVQLNLFELAVETEEREQLYALLLHGKASRGSLPGFVVLAVPDADLKGYVYSVDLMAKFPRVVEEFLDKADEKDPAGSVRLRAVPKKTPGGE